MIKKFWFYYSKILFSCDFESAANAIDSLNSIGLLNEGTATAAVHCEAISASTALNNFSVPTAVTQDERRDKILTSSPLDSLIILRFWQRQYKFKHGTNIDRHPFKQSVWPAFAAVWPEIEMQFLIIQVSGYNKVKQDGEVHQVNVWNSHCESLMIIGHWLLINIRSIVKLDSLFQINYEMVVIILYFRAH